MPPQGVVPSYGIPTALNASSGLPQFNTAGFIPSSMPTMLDGVTGSLNGLDPALSNPALMQGQFNIGTAGLTGDLAGLLNLANNIVSLPIGPQSVVPQGVGSLPGQPMALGGMPQTGVGGQSFNPTTGMPQTTMPAQGGVAPQTSLGGQYQAGQAGLTGDLATLLNASEASNNLGQFAQTAGLNTTTSIGSNTMGIPTLGGAIPGQAEQIIRQINAQMLASGDPKAISQVQTAVTTLQGNGSTLTPALAAQAQQAQMLATGLQNPQQAALLQYAQQQGILNPVAGAGTAGATNPALPNALQMPNAFQSTPTAGAPATTPPVTTT
jgi:hypothetical protein